MEGVEEIGADGDVVVCRGRFDWDDRHGVFIVSQEISENVSSCPAGRARCARGGRLHAFLTCVGRSTVAGLPLVG